MRALLVERLAPDYAGCALTEVPTPDPGPGEVRVRVAAAAVNFPDLLMTRGEYQHKPALPFIPGLEIAGEVEALGEGARGWKIGDAVVGSPRLGGFSEFAVAAAAGLKPKPARLSFARASAYGAAYLTAWVSLVRRAQVKIGGTGSGPRRGRRRGPGVCRPCHGARLPRHRRPRRPTTSWPWSRPSTRPRQTLNVTGELREAVKTSPAVSGADVISANRWAATCSTRVYAASPSTAGCW